MTSFAYCWLFGTKANVKLNLFPTYLSWLVKYHVLTTQGPTANHRLSVIVLVHAFHREHSNTAGGD